MMILKRLLSTVAVVADTGAPAIPTGSTDLTGAPTAPVIPTGSGLEASTEPDNEKEAPTESIESDKQLKPPPASKATTAKQHIDESIELDSEAKAKTTESQPNDDDSITSYTYSEYAAWPQAAKARLRDDNPYQPFANTPPHYLTIDKQSDEQREIGKKWWDGLKGGDSALEKLEHGFYEVYQGQDRRMIKPPPDKRVKIGDYDMVDFRLMRRLFQQRRVHELGFSNTESLLEFPNSMKLFNDPGIWVADSGASTDSTGCPVGMVNLTKSLKGDVVTSSNGATSKTKAVGDLKGQVCNRYGVPLHAVNIKGVKYVPNSSFNLFSVSKRLREGWTLHGNKNMIWIQKGETKIVFDIRIDTTEGCVFAIYIKRTQINELAAVGLTQSKPISVNKAHELYGHLHEQATRKTAEYLGHRLKREKMKVCEPCALGKARQKNVPKVSIREQSAHPGQLIYLDIATIKGRKNGPKPNARRHWRMMVDDRTGLSISKFYSTKNEMVQPTCVLWNKWRGQYGITVKRVRVDNAGENRSLEKAANGDSWKMNIDFGYTA